MTPGRRPTVDSVSFNLITIIHSGSLDRNRLKYDNEGVLNNCQKRRMAPRADAGLAEDFLE